MTFPFYVAPEQLVRDKAEYARKGIARGRSIVGIVYASGILLLAENVSGTLRKMSEVYDRIAFAGVGRYNEFETLRKAGIRQADLTGYLYSREDVTALGLATAFSQTLGQIFSHEMKPFEVEILIAEVGEPKKMFRVTYDGSLQHLRDVVAIGGKSEALEEAMRADYRPEMDLGEAIALGVAAFETAEGRPTEGWEAAILEDGNGRRAFKRIEIPQTEP